MANLAGKTLFITGASRGIGLAIALRAARDGANVVIAAKTTEPHPKLPGTIYTAAEEIEAAGGKALPLQVDIRDEDADRRGGRAGGRALRRHRHPGQQRQRHQPDRHAGHADEALRPDARRQRARHLRCSQACLPHLQAKAAQPAHPEPLAAAQHEAALVRAARRLHDGEVRHEHVRARHGGGVPRRRHRRQRAVAAHR